MYKTGNVTFNVPAGESYQTDNISTFSGIHITDNPLLADSTSASDMLNLYLSTENTLSTRPRLEFTKKHGLNIKKMISVWKVSEDQILYHYANSSDTVCLDVNNQTIDLNDNDIGSNKIRCFKKNDKIYILSENGYFVIKSDNKLYNVINDDDTYVPTTKIVDSSGASVETDKLNSLTNKYKELYYWSPESELSLKMSTSYNVENKYYSKLSETKNNVLYAEIIKHLIDGRLVLRHCLTQRTSTEYAKFSYFIVEFSNNKINYKSITEGVNFGNIAISEDGKTYAYVDNENMLYTKQVSDSKVIKSTQLPEKYNSSKYNQPSIGSARVRTFSNMAVSSDGKEVVWFKSDTSEQVLSKNLKPLIIKFSGETDVFIADNLAQYDDYDDFYVAENVIYKIGTGINSYITFLKWNTNNSAMDEVKNILIGDVSSTQYYGSQINLYSDTILNIYDIVSDKIHTYTVPKMYNQYLLNKILYGIRDGYLVGYTLESDFFVKLLKVSFTEHSIYDVANSVQYLWNIDSSVEGQYTINVSYYEPNIEPKLTFYYLKEVSQDSIPDEKLALNPNYNRLFRKDYTQEHAPKYVIYNISTSAKTVKYITKFSNVEQTFDFGDDGNVILTQTVNNNTFFAHFAFEQKDVNLNFNINIVLEYEEMLAFTNQINFYNNYWFSYKNKLYNSEYNDPTYIPESNVSVIGDDADITGFNLIGNSAMCVYKRNKQFVITASETDNLVVYSKTEMKTDKGNIPFGETILSAQKNYPLQFDDEGIYVLQIPENVNTTENAAVSVSEKINGKFIGEPHKENIITHNHLYWTYVMIPGKAETKIYVWDSRNYGWYYWTIPIKVVGSWETLKTYDYVENNQGETIGIFDHDDDWTYEIDEYVGTVNGVDEYQKIDYKRSNPYDYSEKQYTETVLVDDTGCIYNLKVIDYIDTRINGIFKDRGTQFLDIIYREDDLQYLPISWKWESQIMPLSYTKYNKSYSAINYTKQLVQTGFMFVDSDRTEEYSLNFKFIPYRKKIDENRKDKPIDGTLNYIRSVIKRTRVPKFNFLKVVLTDDNKYDKLNLISLKFKYKLMEEKLS